MDDPRQTQPARLAPPLDCQIESGGGEFGTSLSLPFAESVSPRTRNPIAAIAPATASARSGKRLGSVEDVTRADAVSWLTQLSPGSVDLLITDPPYESLEKHRAVGTTTRLKHSKASSNDWFRIFPNQRFPELFRAVYRALAKNSHFYLFCDQETMFVAKPAAESAGFRFWKPLVWDKCKIGMGYHYRARYELILFFEKGKRRLNDLGVPDIIECPRIHRGYPTEKPVAVSEVLVEQSSLPGERIVDPFLGSGSVGLAALRHGRRFGGCDISAQAVKIARQRLAEAQASMEPSGEGR